VPEIKPLSLTAIVPVSSFRDDSERLALWISRREIESMSVIIVFDGLEPPAKLKSLIQGKSQIRLLNGQFGGPGPSRNAGLKLVTTQYVCFWDSDDEPNVTRFLDLLKSEEAKDSDVSIARFNIFNEITKSITEDSPWSENFVQDYETFALNPGIWRMIFKRELLTNIRFDSLKMAEDQLFICQAMLEAKIVTFSDDQIYTYFIGSTHHLTKNKDALQDLLPAMKRTKSLFRKNMAVEMKLLLNLMSARQFISGLKYGSIRTRFGLLACSFERGFILRPSFVKALMHILKNTVRG
jgi:glycosyltransferase involved in cell wall biosynthesis